MGSWAVTIFGTGSHDYSSPESAAAAGAIEHEVGEFVERLKAKGHTIHAVAAGGVQHMAIGNWPHQASPMVSGEFWRRMREREDAEKRGERTETREEPGSATALSDTPAPEQVGRYDANEPGGQPPAPEETSA